MRGMYYFGFDVMTGFISSAVGAFLGFLGALFLHDREDKRVKKNKDATVLKNIKAEISEISSALKIHYLEKSRPLLYSVQTPIWDAAIYSGAILEFIDNSVYKQAINVYSRIKHFNDMRKDLCKVEDNLIYIRKIIDVSVNIIESKEE